MATTEAEDLRGKTAVVTGATSGIGRWTAAGLARRGARVLAVGRSADRLAELAGWVASQSPGGSVETLRADLSLTAEVRRLAAAVRATAPSVDILVNNAGLFSPKRVETGEGHELTLAVNYLAPFALSVMLADAMRRGGRIVNVGSRAGERARLDLTDLESRHGFSLMRAYGRSKLALLVMTGELARRLAPRGITANTLHPGVVATRIGSVGGLMGLAWTAASPFLMTAEQGARTTLMLAADPRLTGVTGRYYAKEREAMPGAQAMDTDLAARLWTETERLTGVCLGQNADPLLDREIP